MDGCLLSDKDLIQILTLLLSRWVAMGTFLYLSRPQCLHLYNGDDKNAYFTSSRE